MAGSEDERSGQRLQKWKDWLKSPFTKLRHMSTKTSEQSSLPYRPNKLSTTEAKKIDRTKTPSAQSTISGVAQNTSLRPVEHPPVARALEVPASSLVQTTEPSVMETGPDTTPSSSSDVAQPATTNDDLPVLGAADTIATASHIASSQPT